MYAFIIRPFGEKNNIDFDTVERDLIAPALKKLNIKGRTTAEIFRAGNIRVDMFQRLLTADLIIADISIHNANVYYELGIRHALRDKITILIRAKEEKASGAKSDKATDAKADEPGSAESDETLRAKTDEVPFDLKTDRYMSYDRANLASSVQVLIKTIEATINSEIKDSPVFNLLPELDVQDRSRFLAVPIDFREEVERAAKAKELGDLELLQFEAQGLEWETEGLRLIGREQYDLEAYADARETWENLLQIDSKDVEALEILGTVFQRQDELVRSEQVIKRALSTKNLKPEKRAELYALLGRNQKVQWAASWSELPADKRGERALGSAFLDKAIESYKAGFYENLNHFYSGLNALALLMIQNELAVKFPAVWENSFDSDTEAERELGLRETQIKQLTAAVDLSLEAKKNALQKSGQTDIWAEISECDLLLLTSKKPLRVATAYQRALTDVKDLNIGSVIEQLSLYQKLGVFSENVEEVLAKINTEEKPIDNSTEDKRVLLFTGHMIDSPDRETPRFPAAKESAAKEKIKEFIEKELAESGGIKYGIAGGASGGDILFHETCAELGIQTKLYLAIPKDEFIEESVAPAGPNWIERFNKLFNRLKKQKRVRVLCDTKQLPRWLHDKQEEYNIWQRSNLWMLYNAKADAGNNITLIALWDGQKADGAGGTKDLIERAEKFAVKPLIINTKEIFA
jgi:hypothetical protein